LKFFGVAHYGGEELQVAVVLVAKGRLPAGFCPKGSGSVPGVSKPCMQTIGLRFEAEMKTRICVVSSRCARRRRQTAAVPAKGSTRFTGNGLDAGATDRWMPFLGRDDPCPWESRLRCDAKSEVLV
jgi:hypothetical protein